MAGVSSAAATSTLYTHHLPSPPPPAPPIIVRMREVLDKPLVTILARTKELMAAADERGICRAEIAHYTDKVAKLANEGMRGDAKKQEKAESNQAKCVRRPWWR